MADESTYEIQVQGQIGERWSLWFEEMDIHVDGTGRGAVTTLIGVVPDQAALLGLLHKLYSLGLPLLLVHRQPTPRGSDVSGSRS